MGIGLFFIGCESSHETRTDVRLLVSKLDSKTMASQNEWFKEGQKSLHQSLAKQYKQKRGDAKNIILFVGDGMGLSTVTAARILEGQGRGESGEENMLSFDTFPFTGLSKTYNTNAQTPDSAGTMTALITGVKTKMGMISVSDNASRGDCASAKGNYLTTLVELAEEKGLSTGVVTNTRLTHATPAATYAHVPERGWENNSMLSKKAVKEGCQDIALQFVNFSYGDGIEVAMGGGRREFVPNNIVDIEGKKGRRSDGQDLREVWKKRNVQGQYVETLAAFDKIDASKTSKILGLFNASHMRYEKDRVNDTQGEPTLTQMTQKAIEVLQKSAKGFVLVVESGRIDHAHHINNAYNALHDTVEFSNAVAMADKMTKDDDTLIVVTADHSHVFTMAGYPKRGNPILGKVRSVDKHGRVEEKDTLAEDGKPYTTLGYANGRGTAHLHDNTDADKRYEVDVHMHGRVDLSGVDTTQAGFHQEVTVPLSYETHGGEDVGIYAKGPGAHLLSGVLEQNVIFHVMEYMGDIKSK
ncbi:MAG: Alkaline phosphatase (EC [uncultured Sulfurovum sp.]|uniref:Alkaline phosphatase (EC) n=1 Tax=uncultured Sulfurovum sp. TaxID=269237 RepID=A0A6S6SVR9_9BACT|nr:MAG: Alkaline phosphatase (EC [uncultured Sulfurovum sp.]